MIFMECFNGNPYALSWKYVNLYPWYLTQQLVVAAVGFCVGFSKFIYNVWFNHFVLSILIAQLQVVIW